MAKSCNKSKLSLPAHENSLLRRCNSFPVFHTSSVLLDAQLEEHAESGAFAELDFKKVTLQAQVSWQKLVPRDINQVKKELALHVDLRVKTTTEVGVPE